MAQEIKPETLFGKWKISDWFFFEDLKETKPEFNLRMKDYRRCLKAEVIIDSNGIRIPGSHLCYFDPCEYKFSKKPIYLIKRVVPDNEYTKSGRGSEMIDSNIVGKGFIDYLDKHYTKSTLLLIDAGCTQSYGDFTMKICVISKNKIGFFMGEEMIVLERKMKKESK